MKYLILLMAICLTISGKAQGEALEFKKALECFNKGQYGYASSLFQSLILKLPVNSPYLEECYRYQIEASYITPRGQSTGYEAYKKLRAANYRYDDRATIMAIMNVRLKIKLEDTAELLHYTDGLIASNDKWLWVKGMVYKEISHLIHDEQTSLHYYRAGQRYEDSCAKKYPADTWDSFLPPTNTRH